MKILAIETSCDDTSLAIFENDKLLAMETKSQIKIHNETWWVVPEIAAREHANVIFEVLQKVLDDAKVSIEEIDCIWVTVNPWLIPSLLTWITLARTIAKVLNKEIIEINHIQAHIYANYLERNLEYIKYPLVCLTVSWWHNDIYFMENMWSFEKIWTSNDDAAWESYDKVAKMMGLWYPGWPVISKYALDYINENNLKKQEIFPRVWLKKDEFDFSFSWLKSAVKREIDERIKRNEYILKDTWNEELQKLKENSNVLLTLGDIKEISFEFQNAVNEVLALKLIKAWLSKNIKTVLLAWWVSANDDLREKIIQKVQKNNLEFICPAKKLYCMDNAAMVWILTYYRKKYGK